MDFSTIGKDFGGDLNGYINDGLERLFGGRSDGEQSPDAPEPVEAIDNTPTDAPQITAPQTAPAQTPQQITINAPEIVSDYGGLFIAAALAFGFAQIL